MHAHPRAFTYYMVAACLFVMFSMSMLGFCLEHVHTRSMEVNAGYFAAIATLFATSVVLMDVGYRVYMDQLQKQATPNPILEGQTALERRRSSRY